MIKENDENILLEAIAAGDLSKVCQLVEQKKVAVSGPIPWDLGPLGHAASLGKVDIAQYLIERGAYPNEVTLANAILSGSLAMVKFLTEDSEWTVSFGVGELKQAFDSPSVEISEYAFEVASDDGWFTEEQFIDTDNKDDYYAILSAARKSLLSIRDFEKLNNIITALKENAEEHILVTVDDSKPRLNWLHEFIRQRNDRGFAIVWEAVHASVFSGHRYAELDRYYEKKKSKSFSIRQSNMMLPKFFT